MYPIEKVLSRLEDFSERRDECRARCPAHNEHYIGADVAIIPDNDKPGRKYAAEVARDVAVVARSVKVVDLPSLEEGGDLTDWLDAGHAKQEFFAAVGKAPSYRATDESPWPAPTPLKVALPPVDVLEPVLIPEPLRGWVFDISERMDNAPPDFAAASTVVVSAALLGRKVGIRPKRHDDWLVIPNLWGGLVGPPASMKTPALEQVIRPIKRLAAEAGEAYQDTLKGHALDVMVEEAEKTALWKKLEATAREVAAGKKSRAVLEETRQEIEELEDPETPQERRYMTNDATIEKIAEILQHNPNGILYYRDELIGWLRSLEKAGREADRAFYLEAWNGNGSFSVDRIGRGSLHIPAVCVSILGGIQPGPLLTYVHDALEESEKADGLLQRFQVLVWPDLRGFAPVDRWPDVEAKDQAYKVFQGLASLDAKAFGAHADEEGEVLYVRFTQEAQEIFDSWRSEFESRFRSEAGEHPAAIESHFMKYRSLFASLALIFEVVDFIGGKSQGHAVGEDSAQRAGAWCSYLQSHAMRVYHPILPAPVEAAEVLLDRIEAGDVMHGIKVRDLHRKGWQGLSTPDDARRAIDVLADHGWVRKVVVKAGGPGRPSEQLYLHPVLRDRAHACNHLPWAWGISPPQPRSASSLRCSTSSPG